MSTTNRGSAQPLLKALQVVADAYHPIVPPAPAKELLPSSGRALAELAAQVVPDCLAVVQYHQARILALSGNVSEAVKLLPAGEAGRSPLPEALWLTIQLSAAGTDEAESKRRWELEDRLGRLLPISSWGRLRDLRLEEKEAERIGHPQFDAPRPVIPILDRNKLLEIAAGFEAMRMNAEAATAYREALYGGFAPPPFPKFEQESWISNETAGIWLTTARLDASLGRTGSAVQALFLAVSASRKHEGAARELLTQVFERGAAPVQSRPDAERLKRIAGLYRECNLHPRGLQALRIAAEVPAVSVPLAAELSAEWEKLVAEYARGRERTSFLFGQKVAERSAKDLSPNPFP